MPEVVSPHASNPKAAANLAKNNAVDRKMKQVLEITLDGNFKDSLAYLSSFYTENTAKGRKNLRGLLEKQVLDLRQEFVLELSKVNEAFQVVQDDVDDLARACTDISDKLTSTQKEASTLLTRAAVLQAELKEVQTKEEQVTVFLQKFQLTPAEKAHLKGEINTNFFATLNKVSQIHKDCKELMNVNTQQAGLDIMEEMYMHQLAAYEKLFKHTHKMCLELMLQETPEISSNFINSMTALRHRPALWQECMSEIVKGRRNALLKAFFDAVLRGAAGSKPIEVQAHDPLRYVGDMLAWVHQAVAEENELMNNFFPHSAKKTATTTTSDATTQPEPEGEKLEGITKHEVLDNIFEGVFQHLQGRIEQVLSNKIQFENNVVTFFNIENVLEFYSHAIPIILTPQSSLARLLKQLKLSTVKSLFELLRTLGERITALPPSINSDLTPPTVVHETLTQLTAMMDTLSTSLIPHNEREVEFSRVIASLVEPLLKLTEMTASLDIISRYVLTINILCTIVNELSSSEVEGLCDDKIDELKAVVEQRVNGLVHNQVIAVCETFKFADKIAKIKKSAGTGEPLSTYPTTAQGPVVDCIQTFYKYLFQSNRLVLPTCDKITSLRLRDEVRQRVLDKVAQEYGILYTAVGDPKNQYSDVADFLYHTPEKIREMLDGAEQHSP